MKLNMNSLQAFAMPESFYQLINHELTKANTNIVNEQAITLNFRYPEYSAEDGGYHPVEIRLEKQHALWNIVYITDFSYSSGPYPELIKDIDVCFVTKEVFSLPTGVLELNHGVGLVELFIANFIEYHSMGVYQVSITLD